MNKKIITFFVLVLFACISVFAMGVNESNSTVEVEDIVTIDSNQQSEKSNNQLDSVAIELGVTTSELQNALGDPSQGEPDFAFVANELNVDATLLEDLMKNIMNSSSVEVDPYIVNINGFDFTIIYSVYTWEQLEGDLKYESEGIEEFTDNSGTTHYYETIYLPDGNLNWYQAAYLAQDAGGYLSCLNSQEENDFVFSLINDEKYFWHFDADGTHYGISIGPYIGGFQPVGSIEPAGGWTWLSGEAFDYTNWAQNLDDGVIDLDPRDNTQPNNSGEDQPIMGFGEMNLPVPTWGDYMANVGTYGGERLPGQCYGFIIEYENYPR
jgi:hypothetical protein